MAWDATVVHTCTASLPQFNLSKPEESLLPMVKTEITTKLIDLNHDIGNQHSLTLFTVEFSDDCDFRVLCRLSTDRRFVSGLS